MWWSNPQLNKEREIAGLQLPALSGQPTLSALLGAAPRIDLEWKIVEHELDEESLCRLRNLPEGGGRSNSVTSETLER